MYEYLLESGKVTNLYKTSKKLYKRLNKKKLNLLQSQAFEFLEDSKYRAIDIIYEYEIEEQTNSHLILEVNLYKHRCRTSNGFLLL